MEILFAIIVIFMLGYTTGVAITRHRIMPSTSPRKCQDCRYCYEITSGTKNLIHKEYRDKQICIMHRGSSIPVGATGRIISVVSKNAFCDLWKERAADE